ncbi:radical SAM protein [Elusimicrobiota bacterium]
MEKRLDIKLEEILKNIQTPGKYIGTEWNSYRQKENSRRFLLCFPDDYGIGMSCLGFHTVGNIINSHDRFSCERCFAPVPDMEEMMRKHEVELFSLETKTPAEKFDIIGFSFQYELSYTNFINMLDLAGLKPFRAERAMEDPPVIGGGPSCMNPEALADFVDMLVIGEAETVLPELLDVYLESSDKKDFLAQAAQMEGIYVPGVNNKVKRVYFEDFDDRYFPVSPPVAVVDIPHNRINVEINRGCKNRCRFCQAAVIYGPYRQKSTDQVIDLACKSVASTGHDEISLTSLSATDHPELLDIMDRLHDELKGQGVSVVLSSMRPGLFVAGLWKRLVRLRRGGLTFAPETPSEKLKRVIGKKVKNEDIIQAAKIASENGWKKVKLYFMVGLPGEKEEDIYEIISFIKEVRQKSGLDINVTVSPLIPQPHTPFQWVENIPPETLSQRVALIKKKAPVQVRGFNSKQYIIENILTRADSSLSGVIYSAWKNGSRFDQWKEYFDFEIWEKAFKDNNTSWEEYYYKKYEDMKELPWDHIDAGAEKADIKRSYDTAMKYLEDEYCFCKN